MSDLPKLSAQALDELKYMFKQYNPTRKTVKTETPMGRGGTDELMDAGIIDYKSDDGLWTTYTLTELGHKFKA